MRLELCKIVATMCNNFVEASGTSLLLLAKNFVSTLDWDTSACEPKIYFLLNPRSLFEFSSTVLGKHRRHRDSYDHRNRLRQSSANIVSAGLTLAPLQVINRSS